MSESEAESKEGASHVLASLGAPVFGVAIVGVENVMANFGKTDWYGTAIN